MRCMKFERGCIGSGDGEGVDWRSQVLVVVSDSLFLYFVLKLTDKSPITRHV